MPSPLAELSAALADIAAAHAQSLVSVHGHRARSSGFFWRDGLVVTADEALAEEGEISVTLPGGETRRAEVAGRDPSSDVALLKVEGAAGPAAAFDAALPRVGALALALGAREGLPVAAFGTVAFVGPAWRSMRGGEIDGRVELDLALRGSAEGALAVDAEGRAFGMAVLGPRGRALVIPAATVERVAARLQSHGRIARGYLGLALQPVKVADAGHGAMVMNVDAEGPGAKAGMRQGDVITAWNGEPVRHIRALVRALGPESVGTTVALKVSRGGEPLDLPLTVGERPAA